METSVLDFNSGLNRQLLYQHYADLARRDSIGCCFLWCYSSARYPENSFLADTWQTQLICPLLPNVNVLRVPFRKCSITRTGRNGC